MPEAIILSTTGVEGYEFKTENFCVKDPKAKVRVRFSFSMLEGLSKACLSDELRDAIDYDAFSSYLEEFIVNNFTCESVKVKPELQKKINGLLPKVIELKLTVLVECHHQKLYEVSLGTKYAGQ